MTTRKEGEINSQGRIHQKIPSGSYPGWLIEHTKIDNAFLLAFQIRTGFGATKLLTDRVNTHRGGLAKTINIEWLDSLFEAAGVSDDSLDNLIGAPIMLTINGGGWAVISRKDHARPIGNNMKQSILETYILPAMGLLEE
ncbi:hypothetical protein LCGC14_2331280 [marine sediment metagenome]|uniref:Uncharacterized protein n=1 Tax=marine sediment metagenome TaxID=412755 RepID=A0A0F9CES4_9ZZZZ